MKTKIRIERLEDQLEAFIQCSDTFLNTLTREAVEESIQYRFELCYDSIYRELVKYLTEVLGVPNVPLIEKSVFRLANENYLLPISAWLSYSNLRHDDPLSSLKWIPKFIADSKQLCEKINIGTVKLQRRKHGKQLS